MPRDVGTNAGPNHPSRSPSVEKYLTDRGFTWECRIAVPLTHFDEEKSLHNQARMAAIDKGTVERYVTDLGNGDEFPAIIAAEASKTALLMIADGNHRFQAFKEAGRKTIDAYVVLKASPQAITSLTFEANTKHGLPTSEPTRLHQAMYLMEGGISAEDAARRLGLKPATVRAARAQAVVNQRAKDVGLNEVRWDRLPAGVKTRLGQVSTDEGFAALGKLALDANLKTEDIAQAVNGLVPLRSSGKQQEYVQKLRHTYSEALQTGGKPNEKPIGRQGRSGRQMLGMALGQLSSLPSPDAIVGMMTDDDKPEWLERVDKALGQMEAIREALKK